MSNRINSKFKELKQKRKKAFIAFITAGDPDLKTTEELVYAFEQSGVDIIELGVPFSDPLADGTTIQAASERALKGRVNLKKILKTLRSIRARSSVPIALMTYYNPVFHFGEEKFCRDAKSAGVDGLIVPDLPPEEAQHLMRIAKKNHLATIFFIAPTTTKLRMKKIARVSTGFIYYVSLTGVTGARNKLSLAGIENIKLARNLTDKPICVGFGVSTPAQVKAIASLADGVIVGSAIVKRIEQNSGQSNLVENVTGFVAALVKAVKS